MDNKKTTTNTKLVALPYDIIVNIISRLPLKLIIGCKFLSKALNDLISGPSFSQIYLTNNSYSFCALIDKSNPVGFLDLVEFDQEGNHKTVRTFYTQWLPGGDSSTICGYCNGLICLLKVELGIYTSFVMNPILNEFIQLPEQVDRDNDKKTVFSYGLGHCELSNRYKVLKVISVRLSHINWKTNTEIFTIGYDQNWRSASDVNFPYNVVSEVGRQRRMVPLRSALHWLVYHVSSYKIVNICAFDIAEEKASMLQLPQEVVFSPSSSYSLNVSLDKLCLAGLIYLHVADFWVMDEYGVEGSWTKKYVISITTPPENTRNRDWFPWTVSPGRVIFLSDCYNFVLYDMKKQICLREVHWSNYRFYPIPFVPNFVSLRNLVQPSGSMTDVPTCSLGSEVASAPLDDQLQYTNGPAH